MTLATPSLPEIVRRASVHIGEHADLVLSFLAVFARFEYSLKRCGMVGSRVEGADAKANWEQLSSSPRFEDRFQRQSAEQKAAIDALLRKRPERQVIKSGVTGWDPLRTSFPDGSSLLLLLLVRNVRNNLFHGGKFPMKQVDGSERNAQLIADSMVILDHALKCAPEPVRLAFDET